MYNCILIYVIFLCVNAGISHLNMMDHKWSAYCDISPTHVEGQLKTVYFIQTIFFILIVNYSFVNNFEVMRMSCGQYCY